MRRTLTILAALLILIGLAVGVYFLFFRSSDNPLVDENGNPFDGTNAGDVTGGTTAPPEVGVPVRGAGEEVAPKLFKITDGPVALGAVVYTIEIPQEPQSSTSPALPPLEDIEVRYVERASGNIYRFQLDARLLERLTNRTLPGIQEAVWARDGSRAFLRFLSGDAGSERTETYSLPADGEEGYLLESGLSDVVVGATSILTVLPSTTGAIGTTASLTGANPSINFSTTLSAIRAYTAGTTYAVSTKASKELPGYAFMVRSGQLSRIAGPVNGIAILPSPDGARSLLSSVSRNTLQLGVLDTTTLEATTLPIATIADKCAWAVDGTTVYCAVPRSVSNGLPDTWYQGVFTSSDRIWQIDLESRVASLVFDPLLLGDVAIDAVALTIDADEDVLVFTDKHSGSLWLYDL